MKLPDFDVYVVLELNKNASSEEIKKAYRRLSRKYHPDLNPGNHAAEQLYKNMTWAYEVLSDTEQRRRWDATPRNKTAGHAQGSNSRSSTKTNHNKTKPTSESKNQGKDTGFRTKGKNFTASEVLYITLKETLTGCTKQHTFTGPADNPKTYKVTIKLEPATKQKNKRVKGAGHASPNGGDFGDLIIQLGIKPHAVYTLKGTDLQCTVRVTELEALLGTQITFKHLLGEPITIIVPPSTRNGATLTLRGKGAPATPAEKAGNLIVKLKIVKAGVISPKAREFLKLADKELYPRDIRGDFLKHV